MALKGSLDLRLRLEQQVAAWSVVVERLMDTDGSILAFGHRDSQPVVLKVIRHPGDEWQSGDVLAAFDGHGVIRVLDFIEGAVLLERLAPATSLVSMAVHGDDEQATGVLCDVIGRMAPRTPVASASIVEKWGLGFDRYIESGDDRIPKPMLLEAQRVYSRLCVS